MFDSKLQPQRALAQYSRRFSGAIDYCRRLAGNLAAINDYIDMLSQRMWNIVKHVWIGRSSHSTRTVG
jgi:hypothetical protein